MFMSGTNQSKVIITLRNPLDYSDKINYTIDVLDSALARDWINALKEILVQKHLLEKNFCFLGFPHTARNIDYLIAELNQSIKVINRFFDDYQIIEPYSVDTLRNGLDPNQDIMNCLHNHFEILQGTVENLSDYYRRADYETKYAIRQLNLLCHELESLMLSLRKLEQSPEWVRSSQITTFINCRRFQLTNEHRQLFLSNGYDREFGGVYMHWAQIGKTLFEVFRDEKSPVLADTVCDAITHLEYYSGEFDIEWGNSVKYGRGLVWHDQEQDQFSKWLSNNNLDPKDPALSLGYLPVGQVNLLESFGTNNPIEIRKKLSMYLDIYSITIDDTVGVFNYCWADTNYKQQQIDKMKPGYDHSSRR
jgi:hypothetical protein